MAELGKAYVQIVPSAKGITGAVEAELNGKMPGAGKKAGNLLGGGLLKKLKALGIGVAVGKILKESISQGAKLQQSLGGIETLFSDGASTVIKNAENAYKTAGLSANAYMETVTGFAASLLQSVGGDTERAAKLSDMAIVDMSDNANKFGSSMESIQNAYAGFAKQNYTMLDNLKLGYGGTKSEMKRLLADATKLTGKKYNIKNLSDVYEAIHVIQGELGITGATAEEAESTFSGSFAAMAAAASNVLGNLSLGRDIGPSLDALMDTVVTFLGRNLLPMIWNIVSELPGATWHLLSGLGSMLGGVIAGAWPGIKDATAGIDWESIGSNIVLGIIQGVKVVGSMLGGVIAEAWPEIKSAMAGIDWESIGSNIVLGIIQGVKAIGSMLGGVIAGAWPEIKSAMADIDWASIGSNIVSGIVNGVKGGGGALLNALKGLGRGAINAIKGELEIHSPSGVAEKEVGAMIPRGGAIGVRKNRMMFLNAMDDLGNEAQAHMRRWKISGPGQQERTAGRQINVTQNIYSKKQTAADLMAEARYKAEVEVLGLV